MSQVAALMEPSGKSTLLAAICRLAELSHGEIFLDRVAISSVPHEVLRSRILVLPQQALFVPGSVRLNCFAPEDRSDDQLIEVLDEAGLWDVTRLRGGLDVEIDNIALSHGQQQLFRFACAALHNSPLVLLDEPTSSVDAETDARIQDLMYVQFRQQTMVVVAHRLHTLMRCDEVIVLGSGKILEHAPPLQLLERKDSHFCKLWEMQNSRT